MLLDFGGVEGLARAEADELSRHTGIGLAKACRLVTAFALANRVRTSGDLPEVRTSADIAAVAAPRIGRARTEQVLLILDDRHRIHRVLTVATGSATSSIVPVPEVLSLALRHDAVAFALAHNHPSGSPEPSREDIAVTDRIRRAAAEVGLRFLDHVVVSGDQWRSITASS
ncbi:RadC family protein [Saccharopolyspora sp. ASAGF58]|uniref:JAB domain-containing protein n=1 Tax=Saccharopolyspora sp. ASAGF58 TaxID=2719023 RepID=UPI0014464F24|nr:JAB domain-containing protein [Saccharopolyspora sp. ASAGF58]